MQIVTDIIQALSYHTVISTRLTGKSRYPDIISSFRRDRQAAYLSTEQDHCPVKELLGVRAKTPL